MPTYAQFQAICVQLAYVSLAAFDIAAAAAPDQVSVSAFSAMPNSLILAYAYMVGHILEGMGYAAVGAAGAVPGPGQVKGEGTGQTRVSYAIHDAIAGELTTTFYGKAFANLARQAALTTRSPSGSRVSSMGAIVDPEFLDS